MVNLSLPNEKIPMKDLLHEINAFVNGQESHFVSVLSIATADQINQLNQYLVDEIGNSRHLLDAFNLPSSSLAGAAGSDYQLSSLAGPQSSLESDSTHWRPETLDALRSESGLAHPQATDPLTHLSWSNLSAMKSQVDHQLSTVRMGFEALVGPLPDEALSEALNRLDGLSTTELIDGARSLTNGLIEQLGKLQGPESLLVDDVLLSIGQFMEPGSLITTDDHLAGLMSALPPDFLSEGSAFDPSHGYSGFDVTQGPIDTAGHAAPVLVDQVQSSASVIPIDVASNLSSLPGTDFTARETDLLLSEGLFRPLSTQTSPDAVRLEPGLNFDKPT